MGTTTDINGRYSLQIGTNVNTLVYSYMGMKTQEIELNGRTSIDVEMADGAQDLEAVVVVGYGSARKVGTVVGSVQQVSAKKLEARPSANALDALQGQVSGLQVFTSSGEPSATQSVRLHGPGSLGASSTPLYILDGMPIDAGTILSLNPNDFESVTVLKDASATSIYGTRAANGVIYITTKRGSTNSDARVTVRSQYGISSMANPSFYNQMMNTSQLLDFWQETGIRTPSQVAAIRNLYGENDTRWIDVYQRKNVPTYQTDLSVQGGGGKTTYFLSGSEFYQEGTATGSRYKRYTVRANIESQAKSWLQVGTNLSLSHDNRVGNSNYNTNATSGGLSFLRAPYYTPIDPLTGKRYDVVAGGNFYHPEYLAEKVEDLYVNSQLNGSVYLTIEPIKNLKLRTRASADAYNYSRDYLRKPSYLGSLKNGQRLLGNTEAITNTITNTLEYAFKVGNDHAITLLGGQEGIVYRQKYFAASATGQQDDRLVHLNNGIQSTYSETSTSAAYAYLSFFGRADYSYQDRFYADFSLRRDGSSRFGSLNRWATFWAVGGMWNLKSEKFLKPLSWLSAANLKVSYGTQGNSAFGTGSAYWDNYMAIATVSAATPYGQTAAWSISNPGNDALTWEKQDKLTIGLKAEFKNRYRIGIEYYHRNTSGMIMDVPVPFTSGYTELTQNVGTLSNNGVDINLGADLVSGRDYFFSVNVNFNYNRDKVTKLFYGLDRYEIPNTGITYVVGKPVMFYYPLSAGINPQTGRQEWYIPGENPDITTKDPSQVTDNPALIDYLNQNTGKSRYAPINGGFSLSGGWKGLSLQADFAVVLGKYLISNDRFFSENPVYFAGMNTSANVLDYWKSPGDITKYPDWSQGAEMEFDDHLLDNASFMRLKNLALAYSLPSAWMKKTKIFTGIKVFASARNLWTITKFKGIDPEIDSNLTLGAYANTKQFTFGLELGF